LAYQLPLLFAELRLRLGDLHPSVSRSAVPAC
jgi:hypothetical protein